MTWNIEFLEEAKKDLKKLDHSVQLQVVKGIEKVRKNPLPTDKGGYGKPLGNKICLYSTRLYKSFKNKIPEFRYPSSLQIGICR